MLSCRDARPASWRLARCSARGETTHARQSSEAALLSKDRVRHLRRDSVADGDRGGRKAGLDFVRIDNYHNRWNPETLANMIRSCYDQDITPWIRCRNDPIIMTTLDMGAQALSISNIGTVEATRQAVASTFYPPKGEREMALGASLRLDVRPGVLDWSANEVFLSVQVEGDEGIVNYKDIVKIEGVDRIQDGRNDIARRSACSVRSTTRRCSRWKIASSTRRSRPASRSRWSTQRPRSTWSASPA